MKIIELMKDILGFIILNGIWILLIIFWIYFYMYHVNIINTDYEYCTVNDTIKNMFWENTTCYERQGDTRWSYDCEMINYNSVKSYCNDLYGNET